MSQSETSHSPKKRISLLERIIGYTFELFFIPSELRFQKRMRCAGRHLSMSAFKSMQEFSPGTLIIEDPTLGWNYTRAWWTSDRLLDSTPYQPPSNEEYHTAIQTGKIPGWDKWLWHNYINPATGTAYLLRVWRGDSLKAMFKDKFPKTAIVFTWSAVAFFKEAKENIKDK